MSSLPRKINDSSPVPYMFKIVGPVFIVLLGLWNLIIGALLKGGFNSALLPDNLPMANDAGVCFILTGNAILFYLVHKRKVTLAFCFLTFIVSCLALASMLTDAPGKGRILLGIPFGMSTHTAICFLLLASAQLLYIHSNYIRFAQYLLHGITLISFIVLLGHAFSVTQLYYFSFISAMSIYTAIGFFIVSITTSFLQPSFGLTGLFTGKMIGNVMARSIFFQFVFIIVALGYLRIAAHRYNIMEPELATAIVVISCILLFLYIIEKATRALNVLERKRRKAQDNFRMAIESAPYAVVLSDNQGRIVMVNTYTEKLYGYQRADLTGSKLEMLIPESLHEDYRRKSNLFFADTNPTVVNYRLDDNLFALRRDGTEFPIELVLTPIRSKGELLVLACITDMTIRRHQEKLIKEQLMEMRFRNQELEQIAAMVSHDLQEPLRTVANYADMLEEDFTDRFCGETELHVSSMKATISRMSLMVSHLLDYSRLGRERELTLTDCNKVLDSVKNDLSALLQNSGAELIVTDSLPINYAYETELHQLFQNLIQNAVKFKRAGVQPRIVVGWRAVKGFFEFSVSDNGIGILPEHRQRIFHIFNRLGREENIQGHGIGLAFAKKIVEMHGGKIWIESATAQGTVFKFTIIDFKP